MPTDISSKIIKFLFKSLPKILVSFFFFLSFVSNVCLASSGLNDQLNIHSEKYWHELIHYEKSLWSSSGYESSIQNPEFFLSENGKYDPKAELIATLKKMDEELDLNKSDQHAICKFPARFKFLKKHFVLNKNEADLSKCFGYQKWAIESKVNSISLVFATGYLGNPASYFGHPLLKLNKGLLNGKLLDITLNFGAITPAEENPVVYVLKGLFGGYHASFSQLQFFFHHTNYVENELRDLWEYELNLSPEEVEIIVDHSWEILDLKIPYLFLSDNCAYRLSEMIGIATNVRLKNPNVFYAIPVSLFEGITELKKSNGQPFIRKILRVPSRQTRMTEKYLSLPSEDKKLTKRLIQDPTFFSKAEYSDLGFEKKSAILASLFDYYAYKIADEKDENSFKLQKQQVILERLKLPPTEVSFESSQESYIPPHEAQGNFTLRAHVIQSEDHRNIQELMIRPALYDFLSLEAARSQNSELKIFETTIRYSENKLNLRQLDIFSVGTLNAARVDLPDISGLAWKIKVGLLSQNFSCDSCLVAGVDAGAGYALETNKLFSFYGLATVQLQSDKNSYGTTAMTPLFGGFFNINPSWKGHFHFGTQQFLDADRNHHQIIEFENRFGSSKYWDVRISFLQNDQRFVRMSFSYYL